MEFSWLIAMGKGLRDALLSYIPTLATGALLAIFSALEASDLVNYGVPAWMIPLMMGAFTFIRNALRNRYGFKV
jgi:hypothetical protein